MINFKEFVSNIVVSEAIQYNQSNSIPLENCVFRYGSEKYFEYFSELKSLYQNSQLPENLLSEDLQELLESDLGEFAQFENKQVPLDFIFELEEESGESSGESSPELNKPKRGGPKKFYVFVRDPQTKNIKKVAFGDTTGLSVKYDNPERKKAFAARHNCSDKTDKTSPGYWACRINKYMAKTPGGRLGFW